jgi:hypothetical protein
MQLPDFGQLIATANPILIFIAVIAGVLAFFVFRLLFRAVNVIFHLGCLVVVALGVLYLLRTVIR